ncbi:MAG: hypothetical protein GF355_08540 [Candidatus Eisenbacteria bacterium]|nr:hypothetical protein [Candidatus Eisenbacteria bacterium]
MIDIALLSKESELPLSAGSFFVLTPVYVQALREASPLERNLLYAWLRDAVRRVGGRFSECERRSLMEALRSLADREGHGVEVDRLLRLLESPADEPPAPSVGQASILLAARGFFGTSFGAVQPFEVSVQDTGSAARLMGRLQETRDLGGFQTGVIAARSWIAGWHQAPGRFAVLERYLEGFSYVGSFPGLTETVGGSSLGLGGAVVAASAVLQLPIDPQVAFTGELTAAGRILAVDGIAEKLRAAKEKGVRRVFIPAENGSDVPPEVASSGMNVLRVGHLEEVMTKLFKSSEISAGVQALHDTASKRVTPELLPSSVEFPSGAPRVLVSWIGKSDPIGAFRDMSHQTVGTEEGPILTLVRELQPLRIYLFYTTGPRNDMSRKFQQVEKELRHVRSDIEVIPYEVPELVDPTDYAQLWAAMPARIEQIRKREQDRKPVFLLNVSSGSQQMETIWHVLVDRGLLPARMFQARESRFLERPGESRVREVRLPRF